jgi:hypothetical protein
MPWMSSLFGAAPPGMMLYKTTLGTVEIHGMNLMVSQEQA